MRWYIAVVFSMFCLGAGSLSVAIAQEAAAQPDEAPVTSPSSPQFGTSTATGQGSLKSLPISNEPYRPSGFWSSGRPAQGGAYRYRMLGIGVVVALLMLGLLVWILRRDRAVPEHR